MIPNGWSGIILYYSVSAGLAPGCVIVSVVVMKIDFIILT